MGELEHGVEREEKLTEDNRQLTERVSTLEKECASLMLELKAAQNRYQQEVRSHQETERRGLVSKEEANLEVVKGKTFRDTTAFNPPVCILHDILFTYCFLAPYSRYQEECIAYLKVTSPTWNRQKCFLHFFSSRQKIFRYHFFPTGSTKQDSPNTPKVIFD